MQALLTITDHTRANIGGRSTFTPAESETYQDLVRDWAIQEKHIRMTVKELSGMDCAMAVLKFETESHHHAKRIVTVAEKIPNVMKFRVTAELALMIQCDLCYGYGHRGNKCASRYALDAAAKELGIGWEWGAAKGAGYYTAYLEDEDNQVEIKAAKEKALRRSFKQTNSYRKSHICKKPRLF